VANAITLVLASIILVLKIINLPKEKAEKAEAVNAPSQSEKTK
jgi:hypothetical protein